MSSTLTSPIGAPWTRSRATFADPFTVSVFPQLRREVVEISLCGAAFQANSKQIVRDPSPARVTVPSPARHTASTGVGKGSEMTRTTQTLEPRAPTVASGTKTPSRGSGPRRLRLAILVAAAVVALTAWAVTALRDNAETLEGPAVSIRQVERAEMQQQGAASYVDLPAVREARQQYGAEQDNRLDGHPTTRRQSLPAAVTSPSQRQLEQWRTELDDLRRFRSRVPPAVRPTIEAEIRLLEDRVGATVRR